MSGRDWAVHMDHFNPFEVCYILTLSSPHACLYYGLFLQPLLHGCSSKFCIVTDCVCVCVSCRDGFFAVRERSVYLHSSYHLIDFHDVLCMGVCVCFVCKLVGLCVWVFLYI